MAQKVSALMQALYTDDTAKTDQLLVARPELDVFEAAALGRIDRLRELLDANPDLAQAWSPDRATPLHFAAFFRQPEATRLLVERGADLEAVSPTFGDVTPLHSACASGERESARILLEAGADPNVGQRDSFTPLHAAAQHGDEELARLLLARGADRETATDDGRKPRDLGLADLLA
ncbi:MAG: ankyrin repeat domain-containing protein [Thermoleophilia bacterium]